MRERLDRLGRLDRYSCINLVKLFLRDNKKCIQNKYTKNFVVCILH